MLLISCHTWWNKAIRRRKTIFTIHFYTVCRLGMIDNPHSEKSDEKLTSVENLKNDIRKVLFGDRSTVLALSGQLEKWEVTPLQHTCAFPVRKCWASHFAEKHKRIQQLKAADKLIKLEISSVTVQATGHYRSWPSIDPSSESAKMLHKKMCFSQI